MSQPNKLYKDFKRILKLSGTLAVEDRTGGGVNGFVARVKVYALCRFRKPRIKTKA